MLMLAVVDLLDTLAAVLGSPTSAKEARTCERASGRDRPAGLS